MVQMWWCLDHWGWRGVSESFTVLYDVLRAENALPKSRWGFEFPAIIPTEGCVSLNCRLLRKIVQMSMGRQLAKHEMVFPYHSRPAKQERRPSENGETKDLVDGVCFQGRNPFGLDDIYFNVHQDKSWKASISCTRGRSIIWNRDPRIPIPEDPSMIY